MIGGQGGLDLGQLLGNYNSNQAQWSQQANQYLQDALDKALKFNSNYSKSAIDQLQKYNQAARNDALSGYNRAQQLDAPKYAATYNALDSYLDSLGVARPVQGSFQASKGLFKQGPK